MAFSKRNKKAKVEAKEAAVEAAEAKAPVNLDALVEEKKTTGTAFQAYMRDCIKAGKLL